MGGMRYLLALALLGCTAAPATVGNDDAGGDAGALTDALTIDAPSSPDAFVEPVDAFRPTPDAFVGPDAWAACDLYTNAGCSATQACRLTALVVQSDGGSTTTHPQAGPAQCGTAGALLEENTGTSCMGDDNLCGVGLYCEAVACRRYCDAAHNTCRVVGGSAQHCDLAATPPHCVF